MEGNTKEVSPVKKLASPRKLFDRAWTALKATWKTVLPLVAVIQLLAYGLSQLVQALPLPELLKTILSLFVTAAIAVPTAGVLNGTLGYLRRKPLTHACIGSMLPHAGKVICLDLWVMLCLFAWMLPGMGGMGVGALMLAIGQKAPVLGIFGGLLAIAGIVVMIALAIRAVFGYGMGRCILIDNPEVGARNALRQSKAMMHGYRWHYFKVGLPVFAGILVLGLITGALTAALPVWLDSLISTLLGTVTATMGQYTVAVMYEELRRIGR